MYDFVTKNKRVAQVILAVIALPFAFFGVDYYFRGGTVAGDVAQVGGESVSRAEFDQAMREQQERMRTALGKNFDPAMLDSPEMRTSVLEQLVTRKLLQLQTRDQNFRVSDRQLAEVIRSEPSFQVNGQFSQDKYLEFVRSQGMSELMFEARLRQDLSMQPLQDPFAAGIVSREYVRHVLMLGEEQREVRLAEIGVDAHVPQVKIDEAQAKSFYEANQTLFQVPEQAKVELLMLSLDAVAQQATVEPPEVRQQYDQNVKQYAQAEERQASHILIAAPKSGKAEEREAAKKRAQDIADRARKAPDKFADLAREHSQDPGSKDQGGDLGFIGRGTTVKPFEDAVFGMKVGEIAGPIESEFGYHVIRLAGIKGEGPRPFEEVRVQIEQDLRRQKAGKRFAELAEQFQNLVYEQADSLAGVEKVLKEKGAAVAVQRTDWIGSAQAQQMARNNPRFAQALFAPESVQAKRNTEAIEIAPNTLLAGRIAEYRPASPRPFDEVKADIVKELQRRGASEIAQKAGKERLAQLAQGAAAGASEFAAAQTITRAQRTPGLGDETVKQVFAVNPSKLPQYVGGVNERGGFTIVLVSKVNRPEPDAQRVEATLARVSEQLAREQFNAYVAALRKRGKVEINQANLERK